MNAPMDDMFDKLKKNGPPQWFVDAMTRAGHVFDGVKLTLGEGGKSRFTF